jgi:hypothetical protein
MCKWIAMFCTVLTTTFSIPLMPSRQPCSRISQIDETAFSVPRNA